MYSLNSIMDEQKPIETRHPSSRTSWEDMKPGVSSLAPYYEEVLDIPSSKSLSSFRTS